MKIQDKKALEEKLVKSIDGLHVDTRDNTSVGFYQIFYFIEEREYITIFGNKKKSHKCIDICERFGNNVICITKENWKKWFSIIKPIAEKYEKESGNEITIKKVDSRTMWAEDFI